MANFGQQSSMGNPPDPATDVFPRQGMVAAFGDVGFPLKVGQIGMSQYDQRTSPFGWHIVKRLR
jgi:parvulin-like peptidyl-prolyl isomerase